MAGYTESFGSGGRDVYIVKTDGNGVIEVGRVQANINSFTWAPSPPNEILRGHNDRINLQYSFRGSANFADGVHEMVAEDELSWEEAKIIRKASALSLSK